MPYFGMEDEKLHPIAIVSALHYELSKLLELMPDEHKQVRAGREFWLGHLHGHDVVVVLSGIGKVAAATTATILIEYFKVDRIVFTGVAGGLGKNVKIGDVVVADSFMQHDMDASPVFPRYELPGYGTSTLSADEALKAELMQACQHVIAHLPTTLEDATIQAYGLHQPQVHTGLVISGDRFVSTSAEAKQLQHDLPQALAVEMEGAAFAQVCHDYKVPFASVRTISDKADDAATIDFTRFLAEIASHYSALIVDRWLSHRHK
jgi:adenosylhomocysteine nucleosidase